MKPPRPIRLPRAFVLAEAIVTIVLMSMLAAFAADVGVRMRRAYQAAQAQNDRLERFDVACMSMAQDVWRATAIDLDQRSINIQTPTGTIRWTAANDGLQRQGTGTTSQWPDTGDVMFEPDQTGVVVDLQHPKSAPSPVRLISQMICAHVGARR